MAEGALYNHYLLELSHGPTRLYRNNCGSLPDPSGRWVQFGITNPGGGGSDLLGWHSHTITQADVGKRVAVFVGIEVKVPGAKTDAKREEKQAQFRANIEQAGGIAVKAFSVQEAADAIRAWVLTKAHTATIF